jgi:iron complex outermembrane receptor protein
LRLENLNGVPGDGTYFNALCTSVDFDEPSDNDPNSPTFNDYAIISGTEKSDFHTPKVTVEWTPADNAMLYFSWAHAQKPGGITTTSIGNAAATIEDLRFLPEEMDAWELGTKTNWQAAGDLLLNGAFFFQDYTDKQIGTQVLVEISPGEFVSQARVINAAAAEVWGVEFEALWQPSFLEGLSFSFAYTWLDPEYTDFIDETVAAERAAAVGECPVVYTGGQGPNPDDKTDPANGEPKCALNLTGHQLERTPENAFVTQLRLQRPLFSTGIDWFIEGNTTWQDKRFENADNFTFWEDYWLTDIRFGFQADSWDFLVYVDNVFDDNEIKTGGEQPDFGEQVGQLGFTAGFAPNMWYGTLPDPRVWGVRANYRFGG